MLARPAKHVGHKKLFRSTKFIVDIRAPGWVLSTCTLCCVDVNLLIWTVLRSCIRNYKIRVSAFYCSFLLWKRIKCMQLKFIVSDVANTIELYLEPCSNCMASRWESLSGFLKTPLSTFPLYRVHSLLVKNSRFLIYLPLLDSFPAIGVRTQTSCWQLHGVKGYHYTPQRHVFTWASHNSFWIASRKKQLFQWNTIFHQSSTADDIRDTYALWAESWVV